METNMTMNTTQWRIGLAVAGLLAVTALVLALVNRENRASSLDRGIEAVVKLCTSAARKQAEGLADGETSKGLRLPGGAMGGKKFGEAQLIYRAVLQMLRGMSQADLEAQKLVLSRVYSQIGWFA